MNLFHERYYDSKTTPVHNLIKRLCRRKYDIYFRNIFIIIILIIFTITAIITITISCSTINKILILTK